MSKRRQHTSGGIFWFSRHQGTAKTFTPYIPTPSSGNEKSNLHTLAFIRSKRLQFLISVRTFAWHFAYPRNMRVESLKAISWNVYKILCVL